MFDYDDSDLDRLLIIDEEIDKENSEVADTIVCVSPKRVLTEANSPDTSSTRHENVQSKRMRLHAEGQEFHFNDPVPSSLLKNIPLSGDYISVTFADGTRCYLRVSEPSGDISDGHCFYEPCGLVTEAEVLLKQHQLTPTTVNDVSTGRQTSGQLWTTIYAPKHYIDLISDEMVNRTLLKWLKSWDSYVFGTAPTANRNPVKDYSNFRNDSLEDMAGELDPRDGLPRFRVILLAGCPGSGKTTVAHLLAKHTGYQVIEMNASDDRSVSAFKDQLNAVVSCTTSLNSRDKSAENAPFMPSCLVLDEIDGAVPAAVEFLATAARNHLQSHQARSRSRRATAPLVLRRPVICICNDLYSPAVRPLRAPGVPCLILRFPPVDLGRLVARLDLIARKENLSVDKMTLMELAELSDRDIRSCLNALQFLKLHLGSQSAENPTARISSEHLSSITGITCGLKDVQRSLFDVWKAVFTIPPSRLLTRRLDNRMSTSRKGSLDHDSTLSARLCYLTEILDSVSDASMSAMGIFENYLNARMKDASLVTARQASEWFTFQDLLLRRMYSHADYSVLRYSNALPCWFHLALATPTGLPTRFKYGNKTQQGLHWPTAHSDALNTKSRCDSILDQVFANQGLGSARPTVSENGEKDTQHMYHSRLLSRRKFLTEVAPSIVNLLTLMSSSLRPLNAQLYSQQEKQQLATITNIMLDTGLDLVLQPEAETGEMLFELEPQLTEVVGFGDSSNILSRVPHTTKQLIARELNLERMRRSERLVHLIPSVRKEPTEPVESTQTKSAPQPEPLPPVSVKPRLKRDFFGRVIEDKPKSKSDQVNRNPDHKSLFNREVYYRFREGCSNAVRRPVTMKNFL